MMQSIAHSSGCYINMEISGRSLKISCTNLSCFAVSRLILAVIVFITLFDEFFVWGGGV